MALSQFKMGNAKVREKRTAASTFCGKATEVGGGPSQSASKTVKLSLLAPAPRLNPGCPCFCYPLELYTYFFFKKKYLIFTSIRLNVYKGTTCMPGPRGGPQRVSDTLNMGLGMVVGYHVGAGNWI